MQLKFGKCMSGKRGTVREKKQRVDKKKSVDEPQIQNPARRPRVKYRPFLSVKVFKTRKT